MAIRIANGAGFWGDQLDAPRSLLQSADLDYLTLEYLAELTMSILARKRQKDPSAGYATDFLEVLPGILPFLQDQDRLRVISNAGGVNPQACARAAARQLVERGLASAQIGVVAGDDLLMQLPALQQAGCQFAHLDTGQPLRELTQPVVSAHAYLGAAPIVEALDQRAHLVITGRVADASLTVAPAVHQYGWKWNDWDKLAAASVAGHLIECGAQVTGGYSTRWQQFELDSVGYPIAEVDQQGTAIVTKAPSAGGVVDRQFVVEQLVYEIGDPQHYLTPDVDVDFTTVQVQQEGKDRVRVSGATGRAAPDHFKVSLAYHAGFGASSQLLVYGRDCVQKARSCAEIVQRRLKRTGYELERVHVELLGTGDGIPLQHAASATVPPEVVLRVSVQDSRREAVDRFTREIAPLITSGPAGLAGYTSARSSVHPVFAYWPTLVPKELVKAATTVKPASQWAEEQSGH